MRPDFLCRAALPLLCLVFAVRLDAEVVCRYRAPQPTSAATAVGRSLAAPCRALSPTIDGEIGEAEWRGAGEAVDFVWLRRAGNARRQAVAERPLAEAGWLPVSQPTRGLCGFDGENLYVAFDCGEARMAELHAAEADDSAFLWQDDCVEMMLQPDPADPDSYFHLIVSAGNARRFSRNRRQAGTALSADAVRSAVKHRADGWSAEIAIPFAALGVAAPKPGERWRVNFLREEQPFGEVSSWNECLVGFHEPENFGRLYFGALPEIEILSLDWGGAFSGLNRLELHLFNPGDEARQVDVAVGGGAAAALRLEPGAEGRVAIPYRVSTTAGTLEVTVASGGSVFDVRRLVYRGRGRLLAGSLTATEWIAPVEGIGGSLELMVGTLSLKDCSLEWRVDGVLLGSAHAPESRLIDFFLPLSPSPEPGSHDCEIRLLTPLRKEPDSVRLPFEVLPGPFEF